MDAQLALYLGRHPAGAEESAVWGRERTIHLRITAHLADEPPPAAFVTSVRGLLFRGDELMVLANRDTEAYVVPGGRREGDELFEATLRREVGEETGWTLRDPRLLGFYWLHHTTPRPDDYRYLHPDFLQAVYVAEAEQHRPDLLVDDGYDFGAGFRPLAEAGRLALTPGERLFLTAALRQRASKPAGRWRGRTRPTRA
jgi:8-oxo-dGTP pyrophosphatase MutT (NUDIX family)